MQTKINQDNYTYNGCINENQEYHGKGVEVITEENVKQTYNGCWKNGKRHGQGTFTWADGNKYEGEWKNGKRHGTGTLYFGENRYEGEFYKNEFDGNGTVSIHDDATSIVLWIANDASINDAVQPNDVRHANAT